MTMLKTILKDSDGMEGRRGAESGKREVCEYTYELISLRCTDDQISRDAIKAPYRKDHHRVIAPLKRAMVKSIERQ